MKRVLWVVSAISLSFTLQAQVYEWFDEAGNRHFSDTRPAEGVVFRTLGDPAATLSSYRPAAIRQQPSADHERAGTTSPTDGRRSAARSDTENREATCARYLARIDNIHDRLRAGYDEPTGNRLRAERSALRTAYLRDCN